jgi:RNA 2',3'-cyclic 3'-phosphodiesterase
MRTFVAVNFEQPIRAKITQTRNELTPLSKKIKWVEEQNLHLTLKFLGEIEEKTVVEIDEALKNTLSNTAQFDINLAGLGVFPGLSRPRVIWIGIEKGKDELAQLNLEIESRLEPLGFMTEERPFSPHLTIGRVKEPLNEKESGILSGFIERFHSEEISIKIVQQIDLMKSVLSRSGSVYSIIKSWQLK